MQASQLVLVVKNLLVNAGGVRDVSLIAGSGRSPGNKVTVKKVLVRFGWCLCGLPVNLCLLYLDKITE